MKKTALLILAILTLSGCIHKMDMEQGNILTPELVNKLHTGMTAEDVKNILGTPMLLNTFNENRIDYVYVYKPAYKNATDKNLSLIFKNNRLQQINGNMYSQYMR